jgi:hypothetical protein
MDYWSGRTRSLVSTNATGWSGGCNYAVAADGSVPEYRSVEHYDVAALTQSVLWPLLSGLVSAVEAKDPSAFRSAYEPLVNTGNACHSATQHGFVKIVKPDKPTHGNQQYRK